jgi:hypothetical protein
MHTAARVTQSQVALVPVLIKSSPVLDEFARQQSEKLPEKDKMIHDANGPAKKSNRQPGAALNSPRGGTKRKEVRAKKLGLIQVMRSGLFQPGGWTLPPGIALPGPAP